MEHSSLGHCTILNEFGRACSGNGLNGPVADLVSTFGVDVSTLTDRCVLSFYGRFKDSVGDFSQIWELESSKDSVKSEI